MGILASDHGDEIAAAIRSSRLTIYDPLDGRPELFYDIADLETRLRQHLIGERLAYPLRTRSKVVKAQVCAALGYPAPSTFLRVRPRFPGQDLDVYVQKANNLQVWNEEVSPTRRYAIVQLDQGDTITAVRVVTGEVLALLDSTGTLTSKYQAKRRPGFTGSTLVSNSDTDNFVRLLRPVDALDDAVMRTLSPVERPQPGKVLTARAVHERLKRMVGVHIVDPGLDQERYRGQALHELACEVLGLGRYADHGQFPDILCQALEIKLQTSPTIDLGLVSPDSEAPAQEISAGMRHCDVRYSVAYADRIGPKDIVVTAVVLSTGKDFFSHFQRFEGLVRNAKLQIHLPGDFFS